MKVGFYRNGFVLLTTLCSKNDLLLFCSVHLPRVVDAQWHAVHRGEARRQPAWSLHELQEHRYGQCAVDYRRRLLEKSADANGASLGGESVRLW